MNLLLKIVWESQGVKLVRSIKFPIGIDIAKIKDHAFDLGCTEQKVIVECKSHKWTSGGNVPSAKLTTWNEAMYYFVTAPSGLRKIMFVLRDFCPKHNCTLAEYYIKTNYHLIPSDVEFWEFNDETRVARKLKT
ncbi:hypothetical protein [Maridesulfovibrio sp.]|uniref:hypothetical protein n=1 Tax=Maridesulfovibrio sp. TaxID=2795000 RepID=UPI002A18A621|nr:hypothetical protein [Maridesulfovibrio sp.]